MFHLVLISAMPQEIGETMKNLRDIKEYKFNDLKIYNGFWDNPITKKSIFISIGWSGWGKVSASRTITRIIALSENTFTIDLILFTGVAGGIQKALKQWDIIVAKELVQYDMDASPLYKKYVIPSLNKRYLKSDTVWSDKIFSLLKNKVLPLKTNFFNKIYLGLIGTADKFVSERDEANKLIQAFSNILAVEMEGAAVAQVATQEKIPFVVIRVISDNANEGAEIDFNKFLEDYKIESWKLINSILLEIYD
tara:strand:+ start:2565 stop:3317 length:753 start_codon:yes stop_codon:yes gene_type:complete